MVNWIWHVKFHYVWKTTAVRFYSKGLKYCTSMKSLICWLSSKVNLEYYPSALFWNDKETRRWFPGAWTEEGETYQSWKVYHIRGNQIFKKYLIFLCLYYIVGIHLKGLLLLFSYAGGATQSFITGKHFYLFLFSQAISCLLHLNLNFDATSFWLVYCNSFFLSKKLE